MAHPPYLYNVVSHDRDARFPEPKFDPKAVTRASWEPKPRIPKPEGPLIVFNRHPDAHLVLSHRSNNYVSLSPRMKSWIKSIRLVQLGLRVVELIGAAGLLALLILLTNIETLASWVMRITLGVATVHCLYAVYHLQRPAGGRSPTSSTAYQLFASISDLGIMPLYAYGALNAHSSGAAWKTRLADQSLLDYFVPAIFYTFISAGSLHLISLCISIWLGFMFRKISQMPPDMNPLEDHLTTRAKHKKNKSSIATSVSGDSEKRMSTPLEDRRRSGAPYEDVSRPPSIPFQRTRAGSDASSFNRDSLADSPGRQYQITPGNPPRNSAGISEYARMSAPRSSYRGSYTEVPLHETNAQSSRSPISSAAMLASQGDGRNAGKFTETWFATDSLISRTQKRNRAMDAALVTEQKRKNNKAYEALGQSYAADNSDSERDEDDLVGSDFENDVGNISHPNPLASNPHATPPRTKTPYYSLKDTALSEVDLNSGRASGTFDIADETPSSLAPGAWPRNRDSSIQPESDFYSKPYGELKPATPPVMIGSNRVVSSGNDFEKNQYSSAYGRRNVSSKVAEEGLAVPNGGYSRYSVM
ncbi:hypothetical protein CGRA01v4_03085 [Colletotrichum graminicola]|uniref:Uncharacterized protein n=1 Tax=Colletotrichum graminicola (strain M1.001 / M2 / FGSC 10212) TaxID=645133 RepID=E3Q9L7_COLGM|nr:uncharacterized protein GLRG_02699 [Colletotrichum graminicola M1.001]EFQ27555.1 hypothetical protein GLRG_02699 [Colletotrichum graminicola M1.001]WDK11806.1 hypothetical protein CGRA01v4_03085 [Colletotrichum graminicola]